MSDLLKSIEEHGESAIAVAEMLYGDGAWEIVKAFDTEKKNRTQARVGLATNALGIGAGGFALKDSLKKYGEESTKIPKDRPNPLAEGIKSATTGLGTLKPIKAAKSFGEAHKKGLAGAAVGLQVANLAGDAVANRVLARNSKKKAVVKAESLARASKQIDDCTPTEPFSKGKLVKIATAKGFDAAKKAPEAVEQGVKGGKKAKKSIHDMVNKSIDVTWSGEISKMDTDKRQVFGFASIVEINGEPVVDRQGDYLSVDEIEKAAYSYVVKSRKGGTQHRRDDSDQPVHVSDMIESFLITQEKKDQMGLPDEVPLGWWVGFQVNDDKTWDEVKAGTRKDFSIHGSGVRKEATI